jgi:hypothetical protein
LDYSTVDGNGYYASRIESAGLKQRHALLSKSLQNSTNPVQTFIADYATILMLGTLA